MQSTPTLKDADPHDVFAIETSPRRRKGASAWRTIQPPLLRRSRTSRRQILVAAPLHRSNRRFTPPMSRYPASRKSSRRIRVDDLKPPGERPMGKWTKRVAMACSACAARSPPPPGSTMAITPKRWLQTRCRRSCWRGCLRKQARRRRAAGAPAFEAAAADQGTAQTAGSTGTCRQPAQAAEPVLPLLRRIRHSCSRWRRISPR